MSAWRTAIHGCCVALTGILAASGAAAAEGAGAPAPALERQILERVNSLRQEQGRAALERRAELDELARSYSRAMHTENFFSHTGPEGRGIADRVRQAGLCYRAVGENIARNVNVARPAQQAVAGWMQSPGHRRNILNEIFTQTGVGVWRSEDTYTFTQVFFTPLPGACPPR